MPAVQLPIYVTSQGQISSGQWEYFLRMSNCERVSFWAGLAWYKQMTN